MSCFVRAGLPNADIASLREVWKGGMNRLVLDCWEWCSAWCLQEVDLLLQQWDKAWEKLAQAEARFEQSMCERRPTHRLGCCGCMGEHLGIPSQQFSLIMSHN